MRICISKISVFFLAGFILVKANNAEAFLLPPGPMTPTVDPLADVNMTLDYVAQTANAVSSGVTKVKQEQTKLVKSAKEKLAGEVKGFMPTKKERQKKETAVPGSKKIAKCKIADIEKPSSVKEAFYKLFLTYPSDKADVNYAYHQKAVEFYQDTVVEAYVAAREMEKELDELEQKFKDLSPSLVTGENTSNGTEAGDDNNGTWKNAYTAYDTMNELLKITEELAAIRAQLEAAYALQQSIPPKAKEDKKKSSDISNRGNLQLASSSKRRGGEVLAFAQLIDFNNNQKTTMSVQPSINSNGGASITSFAQQKRDKAVEASRQGAIGLFSTQNAVSAKNEASEAASDEATSEETTTRSSLINFVKAPVPELSTPFDGNEEKMEELNKLDPLFEKATKALEIHNLIQSLPSYKENANKYNRFKQLHDKSVEMLRLSDKCVLQYLDRYYTDPENVWTGGPISDENTANYDLRKGISAWAITAFEVAKAERTAGTDSEDGIVQEIDVLDTTDMSKRSETEKEYEEKNKEKDLSNPKDEDKANAINRETELVAWKIGAEAAKKLAEDQYSGNPQWGNVKTPFPIWNDQKNFYNQYIDGKYNNIKEYLSALQFNKVALDIAQELNNILTEDPEVKAYNARELGKLAGYVSEEDEADDEENNAVTEVAKQKEAALESALQARDAALEPLEAQRDKLKADIDTEVDRLNSFNERINQLKQGKLTAQSEMEDNQVLLEQADDVAAYGIANGEEDTGDSVAQALAKENIKKNQADEAATGPEIEKNQALAKTQEEKINKLKEQLSQVEEQIKQVNEDYVREVQKIEEQFAAAFEAARQKVRESKAVKAAKTLLSIYRENVEETIIGDLIGTASVKGIIGQAEGLINDTKSYAVEAVEKAREDIYKLGDDLYLPKSSSMVVKRHSELMKELQNIPPEKLMESISSLQKFGGASGITQALSTLFQKVITQKACADGRCDVADEEYFIGLLPKDKDFAAPKAAPETYMPPVREVVRFDSVNYDNVPQLTDGTITKEGFLNYGEEIPLIWQKILQEDIFVEQSVNLSAILEAGSGREASFMRGGRYPCLPEKFITEKEYKVIDVDPYDGQYMVVRKLLTEDGEEGTVGGNNNSAANIATREFLKKIGVYIKDKEIKTENSGTIISPENLPKCQEIELIENGGLGLKFFYTIRDIEADTEGPAAVQPQESMGNPSELGTLLKSAENGGLRFADKPLEVFERLKSIEEENANNSEEYKTNLKDEIFTNAIYDTNQIGDFLDFVEVETTYRQALEELAASLKEANDMLREQLTEAGFTPSEDFDISNEEDYELARNNLDMFKNELVEEGFDGISSVNASDNEVVEERLNKIKRIFTALRKDKDELLSLNENSPSDSELDEQIKTEEANKSVVGEYDKKVEEEFQKQLNNFKRPFCAAY